MLLAGLIGAGISGLGSLISGIRAKNQAKKAEAQINNLKDENQRWYDQEVNTDYLDTAEARSTLAALRSANKKTTDALNNNKVSMNLSDEAKVANSKAVNENYASAVSNLAGFGTRRKDSLTQTYQARKNELDNRLYNTTLGKAQAAGELGNVASSIGSTVAGSGLFGDKKVFNFLK